MKVLLAIPSKSRPYSLKIWRWLSQIPLPKFCEVKFFVEPCELVYYRQVVPRHMVVSIDEDNRGLGYALWFVNQYARDNDYDVEFHLDDDISGFFDVRVRAIHRFETFEMILNTYPALLMEDPKFALIRFLSGRAFYFVKNMELDFVYKNQPAWGCKMLKPEFGFINPEHFVYTDTIIHLNIWKRGGYTKTAGLAGVNAERYTNDGGLQTRDRRTDAINTIENLKKDFPLVKFVDSDNTVGFDIDVSAYQPKTEKLFSK